MIASNSFYAEKQKLRREVVILKLAIALALFVSQVAFGYQAERFEERQRDGSRRVYPFLMGPHSPEIDYENIGDYLRRHQAWQQQEQRAIWEEIRRNDAKAMHGVALDHSESRLSISSRARPDLLKFSGRLESLAMNLSDPVIRGTITDELIARGMKRSTTNLLCSLLEKDLLIDGNEDILAPIHYEYLELVLASEADDKTLRRILEKYRYSRLEVRLEWSISVVEKLPVHDRRILISYLEERFIGSSVEASIDFSPIEPELEEAKQSIETIRASMKSFGERLAETQKKLAEQLERSAIRKQQRVMRWSEAMIKFEKERDQ